ncbi:hypothetical protein D3C77_248670 [compost metagenome]
MCGRLSQYHGIHYFVDALSMPNALSNSVGDNPTWVEWLMGWPSGWTDLKPLEMAKFREWLQQHSTACIQVNGEAAR